MFDIKIGGSVGCLGGVGFWVAWMKWVCWSIGYSGCDWLNDEV